MMRKAAVSSCPLLLRPSGHGTRRRIQKRDAYPRRPSRDDRVTDARRAWTSSPGPLLVEGLRRPLGTVPLIHFQIIARVCEKPTSG